MAMNIEPTAGQFQSMHGPMALAHGDFTTTSGVATQILPGRAGQQLFIKSMIISYANSGIIRFTEGSSGERLFNHEFKDVDQPTAILAPPNGLFFLQAGEALNLTHFGGGDVRIHLTFNYIPENA